MSLLALNSQPKVFAFEDNGYIPPAEDGRKVEVIVNPESERLQTLQPFDPWNGKDLEEMRLLIKVKEHVPPIIFQWQAPGFVSWTS